MKIWNSQKFMKVREVAEHLRRHPRTIYRWLDEGYLQGKKVKDGWLIPREEIDRVVRDPNKDDNE